VLLTYSQEVTQCITLMLSLLLLLLLLLYDDACMQCRVCASQQPS
jgi:hypothetical protein